VDGKRLANARRLEFYAASLDSLLEKHEQLPHVLALERDLAAVLEAPGDRERAAAANRYLERVQGQTHVSAAFLLDRDGNTVAASNWRVPQSFVGQHYPFRPYFREAMTGDTGRFYAVG